MEAAAMIIAETVLAAALVSLVRSLHRRVGGIAFTRQLVVNPRQ
jgi:hypothetical protein